MFRGLSENETKASIIGLFLVVVIGILANWFWNVGWEYLRDSSKGLALGTLPVIVVRVILSFIAAALTFLPTYNKIGQTTEQSWVPYFLAFQNGFFWDAAFNAVVKQFQGT